MQLTQRIYNVLFLCTGNSARSIIGESLVNTLGHSRFRGFSAGSAPKGEVHPMALDVLTRMGFETHGLRSKSWDEFSGPDAPQMDFIFTVCDNAAGEACPVWPGHPVAAHWGVKDPAAAVPSEQHKAFLDTLRHLRRRIELFFELPLEGIERISLSSRLQAIGDEGRKDEARS